MYTVQMHVHVCMGTCLKGLSHQGAMVLVQSSENLLALWDCQEICKNNNNLIAINSTHTKFIKHLFVPLAST